VKQILLLDNYDSFTYNLYDYLLQLGVNCTVVRNDEIAPADFPTLQFDAALLSPGPKRPEDAGILMDFIHYFHKDKPMLGVCLGHQALGQYFGARLVKSEIPMHGKTSEIEHNGHSLYSDLPKRHTVMRYHSLLLTDLEGTPLRAIAFADTGEMMAMQHRHLPLVGVQYHPESILTEYGLDLMRNWVHSIGR
jgi:anthranilate synthase/aminodeoxychorismate synthase-like glutamine amidotransferase